VRLTLVHHGEAVGPDVDPRRPLSAAGLATVERLAALAAARDVKPSIVWHSGKLRARQTAEAFWRACNALATLAATRDLQPDDPPSWIGDRLKAEALGTQDAAPDVLIAGHFPHLPRLLALLLGSDADLRAFPQHGAVRLETHDGGASWQVLWELGIEGFRD
jgi:phosphohistidine phosphatase